MRKSLPSWGTSMSQGPGWGTGVSQCGRKKMARPTLRLVDFPVFVGDSAQGEAGFLRQQLLLPEGFSLC